MMDQVIVRLCPVRGLGTALSVMYLVLGLAFVIICILLNCGVISNRNDFFTVQQFYALLVMVLWVIFIGFLTSLMLIVSVKTDNSSFILPWLVFHLLAIFIMLLGGTALILHFIINNKQFKRAALCIVPIMTSLLFIFIWVKVYQEMLIIKRWEKKQKDLASSHFYKNTYFAFYPEFGNSNRSKTSNQNHNATIKQTEKTKLKPAGHACNASQQENIQEQVKTLAIVRTIPSKHSPKAYFFGDPLGFLPCKKSARRFETLEASKIFTEEDNLYDRRYRF